MPWDERAMQEAVEKHPCWQSNARVVHNLAVESELVGRRSTPVLTGAGQSKPGMDVWITVREALSAKQIGDYVSSGETIAELHTSIPETAAWKLRQC